MQFTVSGQRQEIGGVDCHDGHILFESMAEQQWIGETGATEMRDVCGVDAKLGQTRDETRRQVLVQQELQERAARKRRRFLGRPGAGFMPT